MMPIADGIDYLIQTLWFRCLGKRGRSHGYCGQKILLKSFDLIGGNIDIAALVWT